MMDSYLTNTWVVNFNYNTNASQYQNAGKSSDDEPTYQNVLVSNAIVVIEESKKRAQAIS